MLGGSASLRELAPRDLVPRFYRLHTHVTSWTLFQGCNLTVSREKKNLTADLVQKRSKRSQVLHRQISMVKWSAWLVFVSIRLENWQ